MSNSQGLRKGDTLRCKSDPAPVTPEKPLLIQVVEVARPAVGASLAHHPQLSPVPIADTVFRGGDTLPSSSITLAEEDASGAYGAVLTPGSLPKSPVPAVESPTIEKPSKKEQGLFGRLFHSVKVASEETFQEKPIKIDKKTRLSNFRGHYDKLSENQRKIASWREVEGAIQKHFDNIQEGGYWSLVRIEAGTKDRQIFFKNSFAQSCHFSLGQKNRFWRLLRRS